MISTPNLRHTSNFWSILWPSSGDWQPRLEVTDLLDMWPQNRVIHSFKFVCPYLCLMMVDWLWCIGLLDISFKISLIWFRVTILTNFLTTWKDSPTFLMYFFILTCRISLWITKISTKLIFLCLALKCSYAGFRLTCRSPLCRYAAWSSLAVSELQLSAATPLWLFTERQSLPSWKEFNCLRSAAVGKAARLSICWLDAACRLVIPLRQVTLAQLN